MDKKLACKNCIFLDSDIKQTCGKMFRYGCKRRLDGYIIGWCSSENSLNNLGCSYFNKIKQGQLFRYFTEYNKCVCQYCGIVNSNYLIWNQTLKTYKLVDRYWFRKNLKQIQITSDRGSKFTTREDKQMFRKRLAQQRRMRYINEHRL